MGSAGRRVTGNLRHACLCLDAAGASKAVLFSTEKSRGSAGSPEMMVLSRFELLCLMRYVMVFIQTTA